MNGMHINRFDSIC